MFRSSDYNSLVWVFEKLFAKVEAFKPEASRMQSAEIFVVCTGFKAPAKIDPRFFNPKFIFQQNESDMLDLVTGQNINSLKKIFESRKKSKLARDGKMVQFREISLSDFLEVENPFAVFALYNKIQTKGVLEEVKKEVKMPVDLGDLMEDLQLLGKRDVSRILKWREKVRVARKKKKREQREQEKQNTQQEENDNDEEKRVKEEAELFEKRKKKEARFLKKQKDKNYLQFINKRVTGDDMFMEKMEDEYDGFDFSKHGELIGKRSKPEPTEEIDSEEEDLKEALEKRKGRVMKPISQEEVSQNLEHLYEEKKKMVHQNKFNVEKKKEKVEKQKKGIKREKKRLKESTFEEGAKDKEIQKEVEKQGIQNLQTNSKFFSRKIFEVLEDEEFQSGGEKVDLEEEGENEEIEEEIDEDSASSDEENECNEDDEEEQGAYEDLLKVEDQEKTNGMNTNIDKYKYKEMHINK